MRVLALGGSGGMGRFSSLAISDFPNISKVTIADLNEANAIEFANNLRTEDGADIEGYIKKSSGAGKKESRSAGDFLFSKKSSDDKRSKKNGKPSTVVNKDTKEVLV